MEFCKRCGREQPALASPCPKCTTLDIPLMLDPEWTRESGYSHATSLMTILAQPERRS